MLAVLAAAAASASEKTIEIAPGVHMPMVLLGTGYMPPTPPNPTAESMVGAWLKTGARGIDTALMYKSQEGIAAAVKSSGVPRSEVFIMTKINGIQSYDSTVSKLEQDVSQLGGAPLDCVLSHGPWCGDRGDCSEGGEHRSELIRATWRALEDWYKAGKARCIGISNYCASDIRALLSNSTVTPHVHQIERNPWYHHAEITKFSADSGIKVMEFAPLNDADRQSKKGPEANAMLKDPTLVKIGAAHNATAAQVALQWAVQQGYPLAARIGGSGHYDASVAPCPEYMRENKAVSFGEVPPLSDAEIAAIDALPDQACVWCNDNTCSAP